MVSSIGQSAVDPSVWQQYASSSTSSTETSEDTTETKKVQGNRPPRPKNGGMNKAGKGGKGGPPPKQSSQKLTSSQEDTVKSILEQYDSSSLTEDDATSITEAIAEAGIDESSSLADTISDLGFDAETINSLSSSDDDTYSLSDDDYYSSDDMGDLETMGNFKSLSSSISNDVNDVSEGNEITQMQMAALVNAYQQNQNYGYNFEDSSESSLNYTA
ncbi:hypothetical protein [Clostridium sp.]|uniref:hypothetical protein n=1 Tax=Clostridium sp. TaxID=1506 RepID=UPI0039F5FE57